MKFTAINNQELFNHPRAYRNPTHRHGYSHKDTHKLLTITNIFLNNLLSDKMILLEHNRIEQTNTFTVLGKGNFSNNLIICRDGCFNC